MPERIPAYAVGYLRDVVFGDDIVRYLREIDATLKPYGGEFIVHGGHLEPLEGQWGGDVVIIEFPDRACAMRWYESADYQRILVLRLRNSQGLVAIVEGVTPGHTACAKADELMEQ